MEQKKDVQAPNTTCRESMPSANTDTFVTEQSLPVKYDEHSQADTFVSEQNVPVKDDGPSEEGDCVMQNDG